MEEGIERRREGGVGRGTEGGMEGRRDRGVDGWRGGGMKGSTRVAYGVVDAGRDGQGTGGRMKSGWRNRWRD